MLRFTFRLKRKRVGDVLENNERNLLLEGFE